MDTDRTDIGPPSPDPASHVLSGGRRTVRRLALAVGLLLLLCGWAMRAVAHEYRLIWKLASGSAEESREAARAIVELRSRRAVPYVIDVAAGFDTSGRPWLFRAIAGLGEDAIRAVADRLAAAPPDARERLLFVLEEVGPQAGLAAPALLGLARDPGLSDDEREQAIEALARRGEPALALIAASFSRADRSTRGCRVRAIGTAATEGVETCSLVPDLLSLLADPSSDLDLRFDVLRALMTGPFPGDGVLAALVRELADPRAEYRDRVALALALGVIFPDAERFETLLARADPLVRRGLASALGASRWTPRAFDLAAALVRVDGSVEVRAEAVNALGMAVFASEELELACTALDEIAAALERDEAAVRRTAAGILGWETLDGTAAEGVAGDALRAALLDTDLDVRLAAALALRRRGAESEVSRAVLLEALREGNDERADRVLEALLDEVFETETDVTGAVGDELLAAILEALPRRRGPAAIHAAEVLVMCDRGSTEAVETLARLLGAGGPQASVDPVRVAAVLAGSRVAGAGGVLAALLPCVGESVQVAAAIALTGIDPFRIPDSVVKRLRSTGLDALGCWDDKTPRIGTRLHDRVARSLREPSRLAAFLEWLRQPAVRESLTTGMSFPATIVHILARLGEERVGSIAESLCRDRDPHLRILGVVLTGPLGLQSYGMPLPFASPAPAVAVEAALDLLESGDVKVGAAIVEALSRRQDFWISAFPPASIPRLLALARDGGSGVRRFAIDALSCLGPSRGDVRRVLAAALDDPDPAVRVAAAGAYWRVTRETARPLGVLVALATLQQMGPAASPAAAAVVARLPDLSLTWEEDAALAAIGGARSDVKEAIAALLDGPAGEAQEFAVYVLSSMPSPPARAFRRVVEILDGAGEDEYLRVSCLRALPRFPRHRREAVELLARSLADPEPVVQSAAAWTLQGMGPAARAAIPALEAALRAAPDGGISLDPAGEFFDPGARFRDALDAIRAPAGTPSR